MRIACLASLRLGRALRRQRRDLGLDLLEGVQIDLAAREFTGQAHIAERLDGGDGLVDQPRDLVDFSGTEAALGQPRRAQADTHAKPGGGVAGDRVFVGDDASHVQDADGRFAAQGRGHLAPARFDAVQVQHAEVRVGAAVGQLEAAFRQPTGQSGRVLLDLPHHAPERLAGCDLESHGHRGEFLRVRPALLAGEDRQVDAARQILVSRHDDGAARAAQGFVRGAGEHVGDADRVGVGAGRRHAGRVADVSQQQRTDLVGDRPEKRPVGRPSVGGEPANDHLRPVAPRQVADFVVVEPARALAHTVADHVVAFAREVEFTAVGQVAALVEVHAHHRVARVHQGVVHRQVGGRAGERLNIDINVLVRHAFIGEDQCGAALRQSLDEVDVVDALVEAAVGVAAVVGELVAGIEDRFLVIARHAERGITLGVDVVEDRAERLAHSQRGNRLRGDHD